MAWRPSRNLILVAALAGVGAVAYWSMYAAPVREKSARLDRVRAQVAQFKDGTPNVTAVGRAGRVLEQTTLSGKRDEFEHLLRTRLSTLASEAGLEGVVVSHASPSEVMSPVLSARIGQRAIKAAFRDEPDFYEVPGKLDGAGAPEAVAGAIASLQSQPWIHRVESVQIRPVGKARRRMELSVGFSVLFVPDVSLPNGHAPETRTPSAATLARASSISSRELFRAPDPSPEPPVARTPDPTPEPAPSPPQDTYWRITGLVERPDPEVWLVHTGNGQQRVLHPGEEVFGATVVAVTSEEARFLVGDARYRVPLGGTLSERQPITEEELPE
ncbi:MAG: hypothetical protein ACF8Q5_11500 [Phycisphaerales bacterium JB040]